MNLIFTIGINNSSILYKMNRKFTKKQKQAHFHNNQKTIFPNDEIPDLKNIKVIYPSESSQEMILNIGIPNRYVLYFGSTKKSLAEYNSVKKEKNAYGNFRNHGIAKTDAQGKAKIKFRCPQVYMEDGKTVLPHIHYIVSAKGNKEWIHKLEVTHVVCDITYNELNEMIKNRCALILNALPIEYYIKDRIPMSVSLPHDLVLDKLKPNEVKKYLKEMLAHAPVIQKAVENGKMNFMDIPIVSYCYNKGCEADEDLQKKLLKIGFKNVKIYSGGIKGFLKNAK